MAKIRDSIYTIKSFDDLALRESGVHDLHPAVKLLTALFFIIITVSFGRYDAVGLLPLLFYPVLTGAFGDIPAAPLLKRLLLVLSFILLIGIFNPLLDTQPVSFGNAVIARGWITFFSLFIKGVLTVTAALLLIATTGMEPLAAAFRQLRVPKVMVLQILLTYRYLTVLLGEADRAMTAYALRAPLQKGVHYRVWGSLAGQMLLRTYDRAQRLHTAMCLRGFDGEYRTGAARTIGGKDILFFTGWSAFFLLARLYDLPALLGGLFG